MKHWSEKIVDILNSKSGDLRSLAKIAGADPADFYVGQDLSGCDLRGQDLRGMDLSGCNIKHAILDDATKIDPIFDPRQPPIQPQDYVSVKISASLNTMILQYMHEVGYVYTAWAYKNLFNSGMNQILIGSGEFYENIIANNKYLNDLLEIRGKKSLTVKILIYKNMHEEFIKRFNKNEEQKGIILVILIGLISKKIAPFDKRDFSQLSINAFYPPKMLSVEGSGGFLRGLENSLDNI